jgi:hypothetical protein
MLMSLCCAVALENLFGYLFRPEIDQNLFFDFGTEQIFGTESVRRRAIACLWNRF